MIEFVTHAAALAAANLRCEPALRGREEVAAFLDIAYKSAQRGAEAMRARGLFITHLRFDRIRQHYDRLVRESAGLIDWTFVLNPRNYPAPRTDFPYRAAADCMPRRYRMAMLNGGVVGGYLDTAIFPCLLALDSDFTWVMEYDVDFSGCWSDLFGHFAGNRADLLTNKLATKAQLPDWPWWRSAAAPSDLPESGMLRGLHPILRVSRDLARAYVRLVEDPEWLGHYEFTLPTIAASAGYRVEDIGREGGWSGQYGASNGGSAIETFRWRPSQPAYFHENPQDFPLAGKLYHPVKPDGPGARRRPSRLLKAARRLRARYHAGLEPRMA